MTKRFGWMAVMCSVLVAGPVAAQHTDAMAKDAMHDPDGMAMAPHGKFTGAEGHKAAGTYEIVTMEGRTELKLGKDFLVERGPDVYVVLSPSERVPAQGALYLGKLSRFSGEQSYAVPSGTDLSGYSHVVLWCRKYSVPMGTAALGSGAMMDKMTH